MKTKLHLLKWLLLIGLAYVPSSSPAAVTIAGSLQGTEGDASGTLNGFFGSNAFTAQDQIAASELAAMGLNIGDRITGVAARLDGGAVTGPSSNVLYSSMIITLAQAANSIGGMSTTFSSNLLNPLEVFNSSYTVTAGSMPGGGTPNAFGPALLFTTPYTYQGGDLIFEWTKQSSSNTAAYDTATSYTGAGTLYRSLLNNSTYQATTGTLGNNLTVLQLQTQPVPEPSCALLLMGGLLGVMTRRPRRHGVFRRSFE